MVVKLRGKFFMDYLISQEKIAGILAQADKQAKSPLLISGSKTDRYSVHTVVIDDFLPAAETHEQGRDVWYVIGGQGNFILGGTLNNPQSSKPGEWKGESIIGGEVVEMNVGDIFDIPPNIPHQLDARGSRLELLIVKIRYNV